MAKLMMSQETAPCGAPWTVPSSSGHRNSVLVATLPRTTCPCRRVDWQLAHRIRRRKLHDEDERERSEPRGRELWHLTGRSFGPQLERRGFLCLCGHLLLVVVGDDERGETDRSRVRDSPHTPQETPSLPSPRLPRIATQYIDRETTVRSPRRTPRRGASPSRTAERPPE